jgi:uncharacterized membrane protein
MFAIHGLSTPHFLLHSARLTGVTAQLSVLLASFWLWMSTLPSDHRVMRFFVKIRNWLVPAWTVVLGAFGTVVMVFAELTAFIPTDRKPLDAIVSLAVFLLNGAAAWHYYQSSRYSRLPLQTAIVYSCAWLSASQVIMVLGETWKLSWWLYHFLLLAAMIVMLVGLVRQYSGAR